MRNRWWVVGPSLAAAAIVLAACGSNSPTSNDPPATNGGHATTTGAHPVVIKTIKVSKGRVLTNAAGHTLYWFAKDTPSKSNCNGSCASYWPPVIGTAKTAASLPHGFGTIKRADGQTQVTYDGHPLYTYALDTKARQTKGNGMKLSGGLWWAMTPSGKDLGKQKSSSSSGGSGSSGGGGGW
jgi:predicted lipoprotein with Yx(FWY)xxD motif